MKVLLFGPNGQVGRALRGTLPAHADMVAIGRDEADFMQVGRLAQIVRAERPDIVINAAAYTAVDRAEGEPDLAERINAGAPGELARAAAELGAWVIHYSTDYVFDGRKEGAYVEDDATAPLNVYGRSKRNGEIAVAASGAQHLVLRTSWVHAPGGGNFIAKILKAAGERDELTVIDDQIGTPTSASLIARMTIEALVRIEEGRGIPAGIYHLTAAGETSWNGYARQVVAQAIAQGVALRTRPETVLPVASTAFATAASRPANSRLSTRKLREALMAEMPDWQEGVRETLAALLPERP